MHLRYRVIITLSRLIYLIFMLQAFAKSAIRTKICCTTYKIICIYQKKAVPL